ncbi:MAG: hypothetical protein AAF697_10000 [Pseudomonadota bacterium]
MAGVGTALIGASKAVPGAFGVALFWVGAVLSSLGLLFVAGIEHKKVTLIDRFTRADAAAAEAIEAGRALERSVANRKALDKRRIAFREASDAMGESLEQSLLNSESDLDAAIEFMLENAEPMLAEAIGFDTQEKWAISVFSKTGVGRSTRMSPSAGIRSKMLPKQKEPRKWPKGYGLVGVVWQTRRYAVIPDYSDPRVAEDYPLTEGLVRSYDAERYASMAGLPVLVGPDQKLWGVVAGSSDVTGRFVRAPDDKKSQAVDTIRLVSKSIALAVAAFEVRNPSNND